jgi:hypothetical protein
LLLRLLLQSHFFYLALDHLALGTVIEGKIIIDSEDNYNKVHIKQATNFITQKHTKSPLFLHMTKYNYHSATKKGGGESTSFSSLPFKNYFILTLLETNIPCERVS